MVEITKLKTLNGGMVINATTKKTKYMTPKEQFNKGYDLVMIVAIITIVVMILLMKTFNHGK